MRESRSPGTATEGHFPRSVASGQGMGSGPYLGGLMQLPARFAAAREGAIPAKADMLAILAKALMLAVPAKVAVPASVPMLARVPMPA